MSLTEQTRSGQGTCRWHTAGEGWGRLESRISASYWVGFAPQVNHCNIDPTEVATSHCVPFLDKIPVQKTLPQDTSWSDIASLRPSFKEHLILGFQPPTPPVSSGASHCDLKLEKIGRDESRRPSEVSGSRAQRGLTSCVSVGETGSSLKESGGKHSSLPADIRQPGRVGQDP